MNLLMILLIILAIWVSAAICYFAWRLMPDVESPDEVPTNLPRADSDPEAEKQTR